MKSQKSKKNLSSSQKKSSLNKIKNKEDFFENILDININKPGSAYNFYIKDMMTKNKMKMIDASQEFGEKWKKLSEKEKEKYQEIVDAETKRYEEHMRLVKKYLLDISQLKEQVSPYMAYKQYYVYNAINKEDRDPAEARKSAKESWDDLSDSAREKWERAFDQNKELLEELRNFKPGKVNAYSMFVKDKVSMENMTFEKAGQAWKKVSDKQREKYEKNAELENKEKRQKLMLWEIMNGIKPKRPTGALTYYLKDLSAKGELEGIKNIFSTVASKYKDLSQEEKEKYEKQAKQEQLEYIIKLAEYKKFISQRFGRAPTAMNLYVKDKSSDYEDEELEAGELFKLLSEKWKAESETVKEKYRDRAQKEKEKYDQYKEDQFNLKAPKRNLNSYTIYIKDNYEKVQSKNPKMVSNEIFALISEKWKKLSEKEKAPYEQKAELDRERYEKEIEEYENETGIRGRTKSTQRYVDDKRTSASKEKGYSKYQSQKSARSKSQSRKRSQSKKNYKDSDNKSEKSNKSNKNDKSRNNSKKSTVSNKSKNKKTKK